MATNPFIADIENKNALVCQNANTGLFYTIADDGRHAPVNYDLVRTQTTDMQRLKYWRNRYGYTQSELADLIHVSSPTVIAAWENGLRYPRRKYRHQLNAELSPDIFRD